MNVIKKGWCWWWGWAPEKVETYLEDMARKGYELFQVDLQGIRFHFTETKPEKIRFCADYQNNANEDYFRLLKDTGWNLKWSGAHGWYIWSCNYENTRPDLYTDVNSLIERNNRLARVITPFFAFQCMILFLFLINDSNFSDFFKGLRMGLLTGTCASFPIFAYALFQIIRYNTKLKKRKKISLK